MSTFSRRRLLQTGVALACLKPAAACAQSADSVSQGCCILPDQQGLYQMPAAGNKRRPRQTTNEILKAINNNSGQPSAFNRDLGPVLADMSRTFKENPGFGYYDDGSALNAFATSATAINQTGGTIGFGRNMLRKQLEIDPVGISVVAICAHEFAHILQFRTHLSDRLLRKYSDYCRELHADYLAGFFLFWFQETRGSDLQGVGRSWEDMGPSEFTTNLSHGTAEMRLDCIQQGYRDSAEFGKKGVWEAAEQGFRHVARHSRV